MSSATPTPQEELIELVNLTCSEQLTPLAVQRLESLLTDNLHLQQKYIEYLDIHAQLGALAEHQDVTTQIEEALENPGRSRSGSYRNSLLLWGTFASLAASLLIMVGAGILWGGFLNFGNSSIVGQVALMTTDADPRSNSIALNDLVEKGRTLNIQRGIVSLILDSGVNLNVIGPAEVTLDSRDLVTLKSGAVSAFVPPQAVGFQVNTNDAEIVDLGTDFLVEATADGFTNVTVKEGSVRGTLVNLFGDKLRELTLTRDRTARFNSATEVAEEIAFLPRWDRWFQRMEVLGHGVRRTQGAVRLGTTCPADLQEGKHETRNYVLLTPEQTNLTLDSDLTVNTINGSTTLPAGTRLSSYLIHYEASSGESVVPIGSVQFHQPVLGIISDTAELQRLDSQFGGAQSKYSSHSHRGLEQNDAIEYSADQQTVSFRLKIDRPVVLDEVRILVANNP
ncbi:FecR domain-containing protein [Calycomorphotria hydatis]|uniref:FecR protein n=1 Tax=Calycomorphotria hydatis TaxID=2528027 RepID=A0A517TBM7_9PLAN|nr:FecR domain-containing protein [Calycomorphotria hydatis]QDT65778.1 FecR protein [Calycomorphotria hydatis]